MLHSLYRAISREFGLKVFSVLVALALWVYVINTEDPMRKETRERTIEPVGVPAGLEVVKVRPERVVVHLQGRLSGLQRERLAKLRVVADLSSGEPGRNQVMLKVTGVPARVEVGELERPTAQVWLDHRTAERMRVAPVISGVPVEGYEVLGSPTVEPGEVRVSGAAGVIERIAEIIVRVNVDGFRKRRSVSREVEALDDRRIPVSGVKLEPAKVAVTVPVFKVSTKRVPVRVRIGAPASGYVVADVGASPDTVTLKGRPERLSDIKEVKTEWQSIRGLRTAKTYRVSLVIPGSVWPVDGLRSVAARVMVRPVRVSSPAPTPEPTPADNAPEPDEEPDSEPAEREPPGPPERPEATNREPAPGPSEEPPATDSTSARTPKPESSTHESTERPSGREDGGR